MGKPRYIYFDDEANALIDAVENKSELVNKLIKGYFSEGADMEEDELMAEVNKKLAEAAKLHDEADKLHTKAQRMIEAKAKTKNKFKDVPEQIIEDFSRFPNLTNAAIIARKESGVWITDLSATKLIQIFEEWKKMKNLVK